MAMLEGVLGEWERGEFWNAAPYADDVVAGKAGACALLIRLLARGKGSGVDIDAEVANVVNVVDGRIVRLEMFWERQAALRAAGADQGAEGS